MDQVLGAVCYMAAEVGGTCGLVGNEVCGDCQKCMKLHIVICEISLFRFVKSDKIFYVKIVYLY